MWLNSKDASRKNRRGGVDNISPEQFRSRLEENLQKVRERILSPDFLFSELRPVFIPKGNDRYRVICVPTVADSLIQRWLLDYLLKGDKLRILNNVSYGFRPGTGVASAIKTAKKIRTQHSWVLKSDVESFFDSIDRDILRSDIEKRLGRSSIVGVLLKAIETEIRTTSVQQKNRISAAGIRVGIGLRQGMPLSPALSNVALRDFDREIQNQGICMVRYADDFAIFCDSEQECLKAFNLARAILSRRGHTLPNIEADSKSRIYKPEESVEFLGLELRQTSKGYRVFAPEAAFQELDNIVAEVSSFEKVTNDANTLGQAVAQLNSRIEGFVLAYSPAKNQPQLRDAAYQKRKKALKSLFRDIFGADVLDSLDARKRRFLDLPE